MTQKVADSSLVAGDHGSTYGGNPFVGAAITKVFEIFEKEDICGHVQKVGAYLEAELDKIAAKYDVIELRRGAGLMQGLVCKEPVAAIINTALDKGLVLINAGTNIIRFLPPLTITEADVDRMITILDEAFAANA